MATITNDRARKLVNAGEAVLIDVREPAEFHEGHLAGAINLPSSRFEVDDYLAFDHQPIYLICETGNRAGQIATVLKKHELNVCLLEQQMAFLREGHLPTAASGWSIDRQFRMTLGLLLAIFLLGYFLWSTWFLIIPIILCTGLIVTSIIDRCYLRMGIAMLPWNRRSGEEGEPMAVNEMISRRLSA